MRIHLLGYVKEQKRTRIIRFRAQHLKPALVVTCRLELLYELHHKNDELENVFVLARFDDLFIDFGKIPRLQHKSLFDQPLAQMVEKRAPVIV